MPSHPFLSITGARILPWFSNHWHGTFLSSLPSKVADFVSLFGPSGMCFSTYTLLWIRYSLSEGSTQGDEYIKALIRNFCLHYQDVINGWISWIWRVPCGMSFSYSWSISKLTVLNATAPRNAFFLSKSISTSTDVGTTPCSENASSTSAPQQRWEPSCRIHHIYFRYCPTTDSGLNLFLNLSLLFITWMCRACLQGLGRQGKYGEPPFWCLHTHVSRSYACSLHTK